MLRPNFVGRSWANMYLIFEQTHRQHLKPKLFQWKIMCTEIVFKQKPFQEPHCYSINFSGVKRANNIHIVKQFFTSWVSQIKRHWRHNGLVMALGQIQNDLWSVLTPKTKSTRKIYVCLANLLIECVYKKFYFNV